MTNRTVVVTGAASGMGEATAREFAELGDTLALIDIDGPGLDRVGADLGASTFMGDVGDSAFCTATIDAVAAAAGINELNAERLVVVLLALGLLEKAEMGRFVMPPTVRSSWSAPATGSLVLG